MMKKALGIANTKMSALIAEALAQIDTQLNAEIERLEDLARINNHVSPEESKSLRESQNELQRVVSGSKLRLDVMRLVLKTK
jgi:ATP-dependent helicase HepA